MVIGGSLTQIQNGAELSPKSSTPEYQSREKYVRRFDWREIVPTDSSPEMMKLGRWFEKYFPLEDQSSDQDAYEPQYIPTPKPKAEESPALKESRRLIKTINLAREIKYLATKIGEGSSSTEIYYMVAQARELKRLMEYKRKDPRDTEVIEGREINAGQFYEWADDIEIDASREFIILKDKDGVGIRGNLTEMSEWGPTGVLKFPGLDRYPVFKEEEEIGEQSDSMYLGIVMHYLPKIIYEYLERRLNAERLVDARPDKLLSLKDLRLNGVFLPESDFLQNKHASEYGWQASLPSPLDSITTKAAESFYKDFDLTQEELSLRVGLINACMYALSATIVEEINQTTEDDEERYNRMMEVRDIIARNIGYILAALENILYFFENEITLQEVKHMKVEFESKTTLYMRLVSPYKYTAMAEMDSILRRFGARFSTRVGFSMRADMIVRGDVTTIYDFKSTILYDGSFESKIKAIGYVLAEILKDIWGGSYSRDADSFVVSKIYFNAEILRTIKAKLKYYEFYFWGMNGDKVRVEISPDDIDQFLKLTKLYTQCKIVSKTEAPRGKKGPHSEPVIPNESYEATVEQ